MFWGKLHGLTAALAGSKHSSLARVVLGCFSDARSGGVSYTQLQRAWASTASSSSSPPAALDSEASAALAGADASDSKANKLPTINIRKPSTELTVEDIGTYYSLQKPIIPEAFKLFQQAFYSLHFRSLRKGGCKGLQDEFNFSNRKRIMYRRCIHDLFTAISSGSHKRLYVDGPTGCGKSVALAAIAEWARKNNWLVMYIPSATALTQGGFFSKRPGAAQYDTIISAQHILKGLHDNHQAQLQALPRQLTAGPLGAGGSLLDYCLEGMATDEDGGLAVDCCLALVDELVGVSHTSPVMFIIDDYNALHSTTDYGTVINKIRRRVLLVEELRLANALRLAARPDLGQVQLVTANGWNISVSPKVRIATVPGTTFFNLPRYSEVEVAHALYYYYLMGLSGDLPTHQQVQKMLALTNGNAREMRVLLPHMQIIDVRRSYYFETHSSNAKHKYIGRETREKLKQARRKPTAEGSETGGQEQGGKEQAQGLTAQATA